MAVKQLIALCLLAYTNAESNPDAFYGPGPYHHRGYYANHFRPYFRPSAYAHPFVAPAAHVARPVPVPAPVVPTPNAFKTFPAVPEQPALPALEPISYEADFDVIAPAHPVEAVPAAVPAAPVAPIAGPALQAGPGVSTQYHAQDEFGNVEYGYSNPNSEKQERRDAYGNVIGRYAYNDDTGYPKHVAYVADDFGFRVTASNILPVAPVA